MKKKLLAGVIALGAISMLCGFDSAETVESISDKMNEAIAACDGFSTTLAINVDGEVALDDGSSTSSIGLVASADFEADYILNPPMSAKVSGTVSYSVLGTGDEMELDTYIVPDEAGNMMTYSHVVDKTSGDDEWTATSMGMDVASLGELATKNVNFTELEPYGISFAVAPDAYDVDGTECYLLSTTMDVNTINSVMNVASEMLGQDLAGSEDVATVLALVDGLKLDLEYYIDVETYLPVYIHMDMNDSDLTAINALINSLLGSAGSDEAPATTASLVINDLSFDMVPSYGAAPEIVLPEEALNAEVISLDEVTEAAGSMIG